MLSPILDQQLDIKLLGKKEEMHSLTSDPEEQSPIAHESPKNIRKAREILSEHDKTAKESKEHIRITDVERITLDKETKQRLKYLGYMQ